MLSKARVATLGIVCVVMLQVMACAPPQIAIDMPLQSGLGGFDVTADEPAQHSATVTGFDTRGYTLGSGTIGVKQSAFTFTPGDDTEKGTASFQMTEPIVVTAWIDDADALETVCGGGEQYGPYEIMLDENYVVVSVTPSSLDLSANTLALLNSGTFSLCIRVESPYSGRVDIGALALTVGL